MKSLIKFYDYSFKFISKNRIKQNDIELSRIHTHNLVVGSTSALMWCYTIIAYFSMNSPIPFYIGMTTSILHIFSPLLFRWTNNIFLICSLMLGCGVAHQATFVYYTGGFSSNILIWFGLIPMLAGVISGKKALKFWCLIVTIIAFTFLVLKIINFQCPNVVSPTGLLIAHSLLVFGWIFVGSFIIFAYTDLIEKNKKNLSDKSTKIEFLLRVILHDMSNSIQVLKGYAMLLVNKNKDDLKNYNKFESINKHTNFLAETIASVKSMYMLDNTNNDITLGQVDINRSIKLISSIVETRLAEKNIKINYDYEKNKGVLLLLSPHIFENQILQNLLTNAIKFSHEGGVIDITIADSKTDQNIMYLKVKDYGIGMPEELRKNLFNSNYATSRKGTNKEPGTGLGMHILKNFIEKMGGSVSVTSEQNVGTEFCLSIKKT